MNHVQNLNLLVVSFKCPLVLCSWPSVSVTPVKATLRLLLMFVMVLLAARDVVRPDVIFSSMKSSAGSSKGYM